MDGGPDNGRAAERALGPSLNYLMNLFLRGDISERICQSPITDNAENYVSQMLCFLFEEVPDFMKT